MDGPEFDALVRGLGASRTRRGVVGLVAVLAAGGAAADAGARRRCRKDSPAGQCCRRDGTCACTDGGTVCGASCCRVGQECRDGQCVAMPTPAACVAFGQSCKNAGIPCCDGLACGSGQGGSEVACWVRKTGRCDRTSECIYGTVCRDGFCAGGPATGCPADAWCPGG